MNDSLDAQKGTTAQNSVTKPPRRRRHDYSPEIADLICERLMEGASLRQICQDRNMPISYGFDLMGLFYDIASYVHQIARGAKPTDMPIEQSPRFYMAVNLKTAASLGISLSDAFTARANEVRE